MKKRLINEKSDVFFSRKVVKRAFIIGHIV